MPFDHDSDDRGAVPKLSGTSACSAGTFVEDGDGPVSDHVVIIALTEAGLVICLNDAHDDVRNCRLPSGPPASGETVCAAAERLLFELSGHISSRWQRLGSFTMTTRAQRLRPYVYLARGACQPSAHHPVPNALVEPHSLLLPAQVMQRASDGHFAKMADILALAMAEHSLTGSALSRSVPNGRLH